jgi:hypothetical protein
MSDSRCSTCVKDGKRNMRVDQGNNHESTAPGAISLANTLGSTADEAVIPAVVCHRCDPTAGPQEPGMNAALEVGGAPIHFQASPTSSRLGNSIIVAHYRNAQLQPPRLVLPSRVLYFFCNWPQRSRRVHRRSATMLYVGSTSPGRPLSTDVWITVPSPLHLDILRIAI